MFSDGTGALSKGTAQAERSDPENGGDGREEHFQFDRRAEEEQSQAGAGGDRTADDNIDQIELEVDDLCLELLATQQPMAIDLRFITTGMRIGSDLERIGDLAVDIAQRAEELSSQPLLKPLEDIPRMAELAEKMVHKALDAFVKRDAALARELWQDEEKADGYRDLVQDELMAIMAKDPATTARALPLILISRHLERIADHATNIAEDVVYMVEGKVIKHSPK